MFDEARRKRRRRRRRNALTSTESSHLSHSDLNRTARNPITTTASSLPDQSVLLSDWWLFKADGKRLAVAGLATREKLGARVFCSAAIAKRHDATTLETIDGIIIAIHGFINKSRTRQNGIPLHICNHFLLGFPHGWEEYVTQCYGEESANKDVPMEKSGDSKISSLPKLLDDLSSFPATTIRDFIMHSPGNLGGFTLDYLTEKLFDNAWKHSPRSAHSKIENQSPVASTNPVPNETPKNRKKPMTDKKLRDVDGILLADDKIMGECITPRIGVVTRSMSRLKNRSSESNRECKNSSKKPRTNLSSSSIKCKRGTWISTSGAS